MKTEGVGDEYARRGLRTAIHTVAEQCVLLEVSTRRAVARMAPVCSRHPTMETVMSYPLEAFVTCNPAEVGPGSLLKSRDMWALKVQPRVLEGGVVVQQMLILHGPRAGSLASAPNGAALTIADTYGWQIFVDNIEGDRNSETWPAVTVGKDEPVIHGHAWGDRLEPEAATVSGIRVNVEGVQSYLPNFTVWLIAGNGRKLGDAPLFTVNSPARQPRN